MIAVTLYPLWTNGGILTLVWNFSRVCSSWIGGCIADNSPR